jgi:hypothetical protein
MLVYIIRLMKSESYIKSRLLVLVVLLASIIAPTFASAATLITHKFNSPGDLAARFTASVGATFAEDPAAGTNGTRGINVDTLSGIYGAKNAYSYAAPAIGSGYTVGGYFYNDGVSGYGGIGFADTDTLTQTNAMPTAGNSFGMVFHGGGGNFVNNGAGAGNVSWTGGDLDDGQWYYMIFSAKRTATNTFELAFQIWEASTIGALTALKTEHSVTAITNAPMDAATYHPYFAASGSDRFVYFDDFAITDTPLVVTPPDTTAPVLTQLQQVPSRVRVGEPLEYFFSSDEDCDIQATQIETTKRQPAQVLVQPVVVGESTGVTIEGTVAGGTYTFTFSCVDAALNESNSLRFGPVTIASVPRVSGGNAFTTSSGSIGNQDQQESDTTPESDKSEKSACAADAIITQNLRAPSRNGKFNTYTGAIVTDAAILQNHLNRLGFNSGPADGILGPLSDGAIKRMQTFLGTKADGYVGPITRSLINNSCGESGLQKTN